MFKSKPTTPLTLEETLEKSKRSEERYARINKICNRTAAAAAVGFLIYEGARRGAIRGAADFTGVFIEKLEENLEAEKNEATSE